MFSLQALSVTQLEALGPDNTAMVTNEQRAALRDKQLAALERAETGSRGQTQSPVQSGKKTYSSVFKSCQCVFIIPLMCHAVKILVLLYIYTSKDSSCHQKLP